MFEPNTTPYPNFLFPKMCILKEGELRVLNVIVRQTYGWHKKRDKISISQMIKLSGLSRQGVLDAKDGLVLKGVIGWEIIGGITEYWVIESEPVKNLDVVKIEQVASLNRTNEPVKIVDIQKKEDTKEILQKKEEESTIVVEEDVLADYNYVDEVFRREYKLKFPQSIPPKIHSDTALRICFETKCTRLEFDEQVKLYLSNPWRGEHKLSYTLEGLLKTWNFVGAEKIVHTPKDPTKIDGRTLKEKLSDAIKNFPKETREALESHLFINDQNKVECMQNIDSKNAKIANMVIAQLNKS